MAQFMKLSVIKETGENIIVTVNNSETFGDFQARLFKENNLFVSIEDFKCLDENLSLGDNFFECLRKNLNDEDLLNFDSPLFEINLLNQNDDNTFVVLNSSECGQEISNVLDENIFKENAIEELTFERLINENVSPNYLDIVSQLKEIHNYSEESAADYCRLCAINLDNNKIMIFNSDNCFDEQINHCLPIKVNQDDGLPQNICEKCANNLGNFYGFMRSVIEAEKVLKLKFTVSDDFKTESNDAEEEYLEVEEIEEMSNTQNHHCRICDLIIDNLKDALSHSAEDHHINNLYACVFCEYGFETTILLSQHIQTEHKDFNKYICKVCGTRFAYQTMLQKHVCVSNKKFQNIKIEYPCDVCNKLFTSKTSLTFHKKTHDNRCETCGKIFANKQTLKEHAVLHSDTRPFQCHICGKHLNRLSRLKAHLLTHESNLIARNVNCCIDCKEGFENEHKAVLHENAENHMIAVVKLDRVYRCEFCEKCFINTETLKIHREIHQDLNPYVCHICAAQFPTYSRCTSHKTSHGLFKEGGDKQIFPVIKYFLCNSCDNTYLNWTHLTSHKKLKHSLNTSFNTYKCLDCDLEFPNQYGLTYHRKTKHTEDPIKCSECGEHLANYEAWKEHRLALHANKKYNYQCVKCSKIFETQETLEEHLKIHTDLKENKCPYCPSSFADVKGLGTHLKIHRVKKSHVAQNTAKLTNNTTNSRPYSCKDCGLTFRKQFTLKNHKLKHCVKRDKSKFVLMVDVAEEDTTKPVEKNNFAQTITNDDETSEQYIDLGNGNYVRIQPGNTVNIEGNNYVLVEETDDDQTMIDVNNEQLTANVMHVNDDACYMDTNHLVNTFNQNGITYLLTDNQTY